MSTRRIARRHKVSRPEPFEIAGPTPLTSSEALDLLYLASVLVRWHRILDACGGDREHALRVWRAVGRAELAT